MFDRTGVRVENLKPRFMVMIVDSDHSVRIFRQRPRQRRQPTAILGHGLDVEVLLDRLNSTPRPIANEVKNAGSDRGQKAEEERPREQSAEALHAGTKE